jgi:antitoxin HicB
MAVFYEVAISMDETEGGNPVWMVTAPAFPEMVTFGDTQPEACLNGLKAIEESIAARMADSEDIPHPLRACEGVARCVEISALTFLKVALYMISREKEITRAELGRRLNWHREQVDRLFRLDHKSQLDQMELAFEALGVPLAFDIPLPNAA